MQRFFLVRFLAAAAAIFQIFSMAGCGGSGKANTKVTNVVVSPTILSLNEGEVGSLSAVGVNSAGAVVPADITFTSSNTAIATISSGGLICAGMWDTNIINCNATLGQAGVGQVMITATSGDVNATATLYVHEHVDLVQAVVANNCTSNGQAINISGMAFSTSAPGCSTQSPCDITSTVGPFTFGSNDTLVAASSAGVDSNFNSTTGTPTYTSGGTFSGSKGQTCMLSGFNNVTGATGTVELTGDNTIASGTHLTITASGSNGTAAPTSATLSNGTATCSGTATVRTRLTSGVLTAQIPGAATVFASVSGVNSVGVPYVTCPAAGIKVHDSNGDTSFTLNPNDTKTLNADVVDTLGATVKTPLNWASSAPAAATANSTFFNQGTVTAHSGGTAYISASCADPNCNRGLPAYYSQNVVTITVSTPVATKVYAANTSSTQVVPIDTSTNTAGTAITLPAVPNSIMSDPLGQNVYLGSGRYLMAVNVSSGAVTKYAVPGKVVAITTDGKFVLVSNSDNGGTTYYVNVAGGTLSGQTSGTALSGAFTPDSLFHEWVGGTDGTELAFGPQTGFSGSVMLPSAADMMDISSHGALTYITSAMGGQVFVYATCDQMQTQAISATSPTLIRALPNAAGAVAVDPPNLDVISTPATLDAGCPVPTQSTSATYDLQAGSFTPQQLLVSNDATRAWIVTDLPKLLTFDLTAHTPASVPLAGNATAFNGGITLNGGSVYVGASDFTVHRIEAASLTDAAQIQVNLKDGNNNPVPPNLVAVVP